jgi:hypothetical protein
MPEPYCLAMVLCDGVHRDAATGKFTILGTFSTIGAREFPAKVGFCVYYAVTDGLGPATLRLQIVDASCDILDSADNADGMVFSASMDFDFVDPLLVLETRLSIGVELPKAGLYYCELWAGDDLLMSRRLLAVSTAGQEENDEGEGDE